MRMNTPSCSKAKYGFKRRQRNHKIKDQLRRFGQVSPCPYLLPLCGGREGGAFRVSGDFQGISTPNCAALSSNTCQIDKANPRGMNNSWPCCECHRVTPTWCSALDSTVPTGNDAVRRSRGRWRLSSLVACAPLTRKCVREWERSRVVPCSGLSCGAFPPIIHHFNGSMRSSALVADTAAVPGPGADGTFAA